ncbi:hypothetical protein [Nonomuraea sp. NPDC003754]
MNEFQVIDSVMPDVPPASPEQLAATRDRVLSRQALPPAVQPRRASGRWAGWWAWTGTALAAAAVVLVVSAVAALIPRADEQPAAVPPLRKLEVAAARLAATPEAKGRYWRQDSERVVRLKGDGYLVEERAVESLAFGPSQEVYSWHEPVSAKPYGEAARKAWKRAGSPRLCPARGCDPNLPAYPTTDLRRSLTLADGLEPTLTELRNLPDEPGALRARLLESYDPGRTPRREEWLERAAFSLVTRVPATPATRAAAYLLLAKVPGVTVLDRVPGDFGLRGIALQSLNGTQAVIDPATGELLGTQQLPPAQAQATIDPLTGKVLSVSRPPDGVPYAATIVTKAGWTDVRPVPPPGCRKCSARL